jgi:hypothetical protein
MKAAVGSFLTWLSMSLPVAALLPACGGDSKPEWPKGNIVLKGPNNYTSTTSLSIPKIQTAPGADLMVCWDGLMKDLLCHDIVPTTNDVDNVGFLRINNLSQEKVSMQLAVGQLDPNLVTTYREHHVNHTTNEKCAMLSTFMLGTVLMPAMDYVEPAAGQTITYMLLFTTGTNPGVGSKAMAFLEPMAASTATSVAAPDACSNTVLHFTATLGAPIDMPASDNTKWHVDWSQVPTDSFGNPIDFSKIKIDALQLGFYQGMTAADLQANFKDIEQIATKFYEVAVPVGARDADLKNAVEKGTTTPFPGFTMTDGVWAVAVRCSKCQIPAPVVLSIVNPTP